MIRRGEILPTKPDEPVIAVCGECPAEVNLGNECPCVDEALWKRKWNYTWQSGWVCSACVKLPRLSHDEPCRERCA